MILKIKFKVKIKIKIKDPKDGCTYRIECLLGRGI